MSRFRSFGLGSVTLALSLLPAPAGAQQGAPVMIVPKESPRAGVSQTIGLTTSP